MVTRLLVLLLAVCCTALEIRAASLQPEDLLGTPQEQSDVRQRPALDALLAPWRPLARTARMAESGPLAPLRARRVLSSSPGGARLAVLDAEGDGRPDLVTIIRQPDGAYLHEVRPGLPGGGFAPEPAWTLPTRGGHWLSGDYLPLSPTGLPGFLRVEQRPFGLLGLRAATRLAWHTCGRDGCEGTPSWRLTAKGALVPGKGVRDVDGDGRPDLLLIDAMAPSLSLGGLAADFAAGRAWMELRLHLQRSDGTFPETPDQELRLPLGLGSAARFSWRETPGGSPILLLGDPTAPTALLHWQGGALRPVEPGR